MKVLIAANTSNAAALEGAAQLIGWLRERGITPVSGREEAEALGQPLLFGGDRAGEDLVLAVALGGDGTILRAFHALGDSETPLLGVKYGRLGFLAGCTPDTVTESVESALAGEAHIERRATLKAHVFMDGREVGEFRAMNEIALARGASARVVDFSLAVNGRTVLEMRGDGLVVATATGSTAYALSAGGPIVAPGYGGMVVVPVAPHTLKSRPLLTAPSDVIEIRIQERGALDAVVVVDGDPAPARQPVELVRVQRGERDVVLVKAQDRDFYETVASEFFETGR